MIIDFAMFDLSSILSTVISTIIIAILTYLTIIFKKNNEIMNNILEKQEKYDRILFGEEDITEWSGIIKIMTDLKDSTRENRYIIRIITNKLVNKDYLDIKDREIECISNMLNDLGD